MAFTRLARTSIAALIAFAGLVFPVTASNASSGQLIGPVTHEGYVGANGGGYWDASCNVGDVLVGLRGYSDGWQGSGALRNNIGLECAPLDASGVIQSTSAYWFGADGNQIMCPAGQAVVGLNGSPSTSWYVVVGTVGIICGSATDPTVEDSSQGFVGGGPAPSQTMHCPAHSYVVGAFGRHGNVMDQVGPICQKYLRVPKAVTVVAVVALNHQAQVTFTPPADDGGSAVLSYEYSTDGGTSWSAVPAGQISSPLLISDLFNGQTYSVALRALNVVGPGSSSDAMSVTPLTSTSEPTITLVDAGNEQATVSFTAPSENGGAEITNYEFSVDGGIAWTSCSPALTTSPMVITGLANGSTISIKIRAVNAAGYGYSSNPVSVKPIAPASTPTISDVISGNSQISFSIRAPLQINDSALSGYDFSINNGSTWSRFASVDGPFTITGLTNGIAYPVKVRAVNSAGPGAASDSVTVNPTKLVPAQPVISAVTGGNRSAIVNITKPTDVTSQSITGYQYSVDKGSSYHNAALSNDSFLIGGLTNGTATSVIVRAVNFNGTSKVSSIKTVVPATTPEAPVISAITPSAGALSIGFTAPNNGGKAVTSYQYSLDGGSTWVVPAKAIAKSPIKITGLPNATEYQVKIRAVNVLGIGQSSASVLASTPAVVASAPTITLASAGKTSITVDFTAPTNNGGAAVTNYAYTVDGKTWTTLSPASASTQIVITGLTSYKAYTVKLRAINSAGFGAISASASVKTLK